MLARDSDGLADQLAARSTNSPLRSSRIARAPASARQSRRAMIFLSATLPPDGWRELFGASRWSRAKK
jgi:hypothetical protein